MYPHRTSSMTSLYILITCINRWIKIWRERNKFHLVEKTTLNAYHTWFVWKEKRNECQSMCFEPFDVHLELADWSVDFVLLPSRESEGEGSARNSSNGRASALNLLDAAHLDPGAPKNCVVTPRWMTSVLSKQCDEKNKKIPSRRHPNTGDKFSRIFGAEFFYSSIDQTFLSKNDEF